MFKSILLFFFLHPSIATRLPHPLASILYVSYPTIWLLLAASFNCCPQAHPSFTPLLPWTLHTLLPGCSSHFCSSGCICVHSLFSLFGSGISLLGFFMDTPPGCSLSLTALLGFSPQLGASPPPPHRVSPTQGCRFCYPAHGFSSHNSLAWSCFEWNSAGLSAVSIHSQTALSSLLSPHISRQAQGRLVSLQRKQSPAVSLFHRLSQTYGNLSLQFVKFHLYFPINCLNLSFKKKIKI